MKTIKQKYVIKTPIAKVWQALVDPKLIDDWGAGPAQMSDQEGFEFKLWGGDIYGKNIKVIPESLLIQEWTAGDWQNPSKVSFSLKGDKGKTTIELLHENIPDKEASEIDIGWHQYYMGPLKEYVEKIL